MTRGTLSQFACAWTALAWLAALLVLGAGAGRAATLTWDASGTGSLTDGPGTWDIDTKWWNGSADGVWTFGSDAVFGHGGPAGAVTLGSATTLNSLTMNSFTGTYTLGTASQTITLNNGITLNAGAGATTIVSPVTLGAVQSWLNNSTNLLTLAAVDNGGYLLTVGGSGNTTVSGSLSDTGGLTLNGNGTLTLATANSYSGNTTINAGTLVANGKGAVAGTTNFTVATNATLVLSGSTGSTAWGPATVTGAGTVAVHGVRYNVGLNYNLSTFTGTLDLIGGQFSLTPAYSPQFWNPTNGTIIVEDGTTVYLGWQGFVLNSTVRVRGYTDDGENLGLLRADTATLNGSLILETNTTIGAGGNFIVNAVISDGGMSNGFTKILGGKLILNANNTYSGPTIVNAGTLQCNNAGALGNYGPLTLISPATLNLNYAGTHFVSVLDLGGGNPQPPGTYGSSTSTAPLTNQFDWDFTGTGTLTVPGPAEIIAFTVPGAVSVAIDPIALTIAVTLPPRTPVTSLAPTYTLSSGTCVPASGSTHNFSSPVTYTVTDGATVHAYTVTMIVPPTYYWAGSNGGNWSTPANWDNAVPGPSDVPIFSDTASAGATINLDADVTVPGLIFNNLVTNQTIASTGGYTLTLDGAIQMPAGTLTLSCPIVATNVGLAKSGAGMLNIRGALQTTYQNPNSWEQVPVSGIELSGTGSWTIVNDYPVMDITGTLTVNDNAMIDWSSSVFTVAAWPGDKGIVVQNGGVVKTIAQTTVWNGCCQGPGLILGHDSYFGGSGASTAEYDLNGGILITPSVYCINGIDNFSLQPPAGSAVFRFNGGILQATQSDPADPNILKEGDTNLLGNLSHAYVGLGGAKIDVTTFNCGISQALEHDPALGASPDGGLRVMATGGGGTLALYQVGTFTGPLVIDSGARLDVGVANQIVSSLSLGGVAQPSGTYGSSSSLATHKNDTYFAGAGTVTVSPLVAGFTATPGSGTLPLQVVFMDTSASIGGTITNWSWDFGNGGTTNYTSYTPSLTNTSYKVWGTYAVTLIVKDNAGRAATNVASLAFTQPANLIVSSQTQLQSVIANIGPQTLAFAPGIGTFELGGLTGGGRLSLADTGGGCVTLVVGGSGPDTEFDGVLSGCGGLTKVGADQFTLAAANNTYLGDTVVSNGTLHLAGALPGLFEGLVANGNNSWDTADPIPHSSIQLEARMADTSAGWTGNTTWGYTGYFHNPATNDVVYTFGKSFDDNGLITIDGTNVINNQSWNTFPTATLTLSPGWHTLELRVGQGGGGVGPYNNNMYDNTLAKQVGLGWSSDGFTWNGFWDPGDGSVLEAFNGVNVLPTNTTLRVATPGIVHLDGMNTVKFLYINGAPKTAGTWGSATSGAANVDSHFTGNGRLVVSQTATSPTPVLPAGSLSMPGGVPTFTGIPTVAGYTYYLVWKNNLTDAGWTRITPGTPSTGQPITLTDPTTSLPQHRFYRIEAQ